MREILSGSVGAAMATAAAASMPVATTCSAAMAAAATSAIVRGANVEIWERAQRESRLKVQHAIQGIAWIDRLEFHDLSGASGPCRICTSRHGHHHDQNEQHCQTRCHGSPVLGNRDGAHLDAPVDVLPAPVALSWAKS